MARIDISYGIIPLRRVLSCWEALLVKHGHGHWAFPKGHANPSEEIRDAATRELKEETGLEIVRFLDVPQLEEKYIFRWKGELVSKTVMYFPAEVHGDVVIQAAEISDFKWNTLPEAKRLATFPATKQVCVAIQDILSKV